MDEEMERRETDMLLTKGVLSVNEVRAKMG